MSNNPTNPTHQNEPVSTDSTPDTQTPPAQRVIEIEAIKTKAMEEILEKLLKEHPQSFKEFKLRDFFGISNDPNSNETGRTQLDETLDQTYDKLFHQPWWKIFRDAFPTTLCVSVCFSIIASLFGLYLNYQTEVRENTKADHLNDQRIIEKYFDTLKEISLSSDYSDKNFDTLQALVAVTQNKTPQNLQDSDTNDSPKDNWNHHKIEFMQNVTSVTLRELSPGSSRKSRMVLLLHKLGIPQKLRLEYESSEKSGDFYDDADLKFTDFTGYEIKNINLSKADLRGANFTKVMAQGSKLIYADLSCAEIEEPNAFGWIPFFRASYRQNQKCANFTDAKLQDADLSNANLQEATLEQTKLQDADLSNANLQGVTLQGSNLQGADLNKTNLVGAVLKEVTLTGVDLTETYLTLTPEQPNSENLQTSKSILKVSDSDLTEVILDEVNLSGVQLENVTLTGGSFEKADLTQYDLVDKLDALVDKLDADLGSELTTKNKFVRYFVPKEVQDEIEGFSFRIDNKIKEINILNKVDKNYDSTELPKKYSQDDDKMQAKSAGMTEQTEIRTDEKLQELKTLIVDLTALIKQKLPNAILTDVDLRKSKLMEADLRGAILTDVDLINADLRGIALGNATLKAVKLTGADLTGADFTGATVDNMDFRQVKVGILRDTNFRRATLTDANFSNLILDNVDFSGADLRGANFRDVKCFSECKIDEKANISGAVFSQDILDKNPGLEQQLAKRWATVEE
ncbi:pentapeptide repeat-containing protein [Roseofilum casamattae]|uniref:Pentapeptide repeat-containing protein n=1 Tax=Roseofilum casamattae BLCC-M143 TaxID=3022442 RepID=A0ABT7C0D9_9CYAN|nr:pentapeptide repeat-containing protein [Roseofilum casamattae]MDJ1184916.1 pentapeptide repeat-containing protein [Roseofilum casamattae BLCC-M143]